MFELTHCTYQYSSQLTIRFPDWQVAQGEKWLLTGVSGSGKTTLLHMLAGLRKPSAGQIRMAGTDLYALQGAAADRFRGQHIGLVLQKPHLLPTLTVMENLLLAPYMAGVACTRERIHTLLRHLELSDKAHALPHQLSQGQAQRVAIARAVLNKPKLLLADEPTSSLDDKNCQTVLHLIEKQAQSCGATLVIATHDIRIKSHIPNHFHLSGQLAV